MTTLPRSETVLIRREHLLTLLTASESLAEMLDIDDARAPDEVVLEAGLYDERAFSEAEIAAGDNVDADTGEVFEAKFAPSAALDAAREAAEQALGLCLPTGTPSATPAGPDQDAGAAGSGATHQAGPAPVGEAVGVGN